MLYREVQVGEETVVRSDGGLCIAAEATPHKTIEVDISSEPVTLVRPLFSTKLYFISC